MLSKLLRMVGVMSKPVKPMLAVDADLDKVKFPVLCSFKLDGIRCVITDGVVMSRSGKPIRNKHVQKLFGKPEYNGLDGELIVGDIWADDVFQKTSSGVMSADGEPDVKLYVFDNYLYEGTYLERYLKLTDAEATDWCGKGLEVLTQQQVDSVEQVHEIMDFIESKHGEGLILRSLDGKYKHGRSTVKEGYLLKVKFFLDDEFEVVDFEERFTNTNELELDELGYAKRSSAKDGLVPMDMLGGLVLKYGNTTFKCGTGFTEAQRKEIWQNKVDFLGKLAKIRYMSVGMKDLPRVPSFQGWRDPDDL